MNRKDEHQGNKIGQRRFCEQDEAYCNEFEEVEAEAEATIQYTPRLTYRRMSFKARRTRASLQQSSQKENNEGQTERRGTRGDGIPTPRSKSCKASRLAEIAKSWIPRAVPNKKGSVSSVSLQVELESKKCSNSNSNINLAIARKRMGSRSQPTKKTSVIQQRLNSAKEIQIKDLTSKVHLLETTIQDLTTENKTLKSSFQRQAAALQKYEGTESDFPRVLNFHQSEVKYLQQTLRKLQGTSRKYETMVRGLNNRIVLLEDHNRTLQILVESNDLEERQKLQHRVMDISRQFSEAQQILADHGRQFDLLRKNHAHQLSTIQAKLKTSDNRVFDAEQELYRLTELIHQKDRVISYLRMRSRDPGLEPPLHKKVMEEFKSSYKYFYQIEPPQNTVLTERHGSNSPSEIGYQSRREDSGEYGIDLPGKDRSHSEIFQNPTTGQSASSSPVPGNKPVKYCSSTKSNDTLFSEELARHSRERNLDIPCPLSDFEEEEEGAEESEYKNDQENYDDEENGGTEAELMDAFRSMTQRSSKSRGEQSGKTYILYKNVEDSEAFLNQFLNHQSSSEENQEDFVQESSPPQTSPQNHSNEHHERSRIRVQNPTQETHYKRIYGSGDTDLDSQVHDENCEFEGNEAQSPGEEDYDEIQNVCSDSYSEEDEHEQGHTKYSEEEFYCDSGNDNEAGDNFSSRRTHHQPRYSDTGSMTPSAVSPKTVTFSPEDKKYFAFKSNPSCIDADGDGRPSDDSDSEIVSKHDAFFDENLTPMNSAEGAMEGVNFYRNSAQSNASGSTNSHNSLAILHAMRPKGPGPMEETPSDSREYSAVSDCRETPISSTEVDLIDLKTKEKVWCGLGIGEPRPQDIKTIKELRIPSRLPSKETYATPTTSSTLKKRNPVIPPRLIKKPLTKQPNKPMRFI